MGSRLFKSAHTLRSGSAPRPRPRPGDTSAAIHLAMGRPHQCRTGVARHSTPGGHAPDPPTERRFLRGATPGVDRTRDTPTTSCVSTPACIEPRKAHRVREDGSNNVTGASKHGRPSVLTGRRSGTRLPPCRSGLEPPRSEHRQRTVARRSPATEPVGGARQQPPSLAPPQARGALEPPTIDPPPLAVVSYSLRLVPPAAAILIASGRGGRTRGAAHEGRKQLVLVGGCSLPVLHRTDRYGEDRYHARVRHPARG
jgi:hypothetical protein